MPFAKTCQQCGKKFVAKERKPKYCSRPCAAKANARKGEGNSLWRGGQIVKTCKFCGAEYKVKKSLESTSNFCSKACAAKGTASRGKDSPAWKGGPFTKVCPTCGEEFTRDWSGAKFCSRACSNRGRDLPKGNKHHKWQGGPVKCTCAHCGIEFTARRDVAGDHKFCSMECSQKSQKGRVGLNLGRTFGPETRAKISAAMSGRILSEEQKAGIVAATMERALYNKPNKLRAMLRDLILDIGRVPDHREMTKFEMPSYTTFRRAFGSWNAAVEAAGFEPNEGLGKKTTARCGHMARSSGECSVCNWLHDHGLEHEHEPRYGEDNLWRADWKVNGALVEYWGLTSESYLERRSEKEEYAQEHGLVLVGLEPADNLDDTLSILL